MATTTAAPATAQRRPQSLASACSLTSAKQQASPRTGSFVGSRASTPLDTRAVDNDEWATIANSASHATDSELSFDRHSSDSDGSSSSDAESDGDNYGARPRGGRRSKKHHGLDTESVGARSAAYEQSTVLSAPTTVSENHNNGSDDDDDGGDDGDDGDNGDEGDGEGEEDDDDAGENERRRSRNRRVDEGSRMRLDKEQRGAEHEAI
jgi:hypothetical protein